MYEFLIVAIEKNMNSVIATDVTDAQGWMY